MDFIVINIQHYMTEADELVGVDSKGNEATLQLFQQSMYLFPHQCH